MQPGMGPQNQPMPMYEWNNTIEGSANLDDPDIDFDGDGWVVEGRDYHNDTEAPGFVAYPYPHPLARID
jgi:hypothetical protein